jgi:uncharacterized membrane protein (DUF4010 family)
MLLRNGLLLAILGPRRALLATGIPLLAMLAICTAFAISRPRKSVEANDSPAQPLKMTSPFSLTSALRFGLIFLALQVAAVISQREFGQLGVYVVSLIGGLFSSASAVASVATLASAGKISNLVAGYSALIASIGSVLINLPLVGRAKDRRFFLRVGFVLALVVLVGAAIAVIQAIWLPRVVALAGSDPISDFGGADVWISSGLED